MSDIKRQYAGFASIIAAVLVIGTPAMGQAREGAPQGPTLVYVGTRDDAPHTGIVAARFDPATGTLAGLGLVAEVVHPTWLLASPHRSILYSVSEVGNDGRSEASVHSFAADQASGRLTPISSVGSGGGGATFLALDAKATSPAILVANYGTGQVGVLPLGSGGVLNPPAAVATESGSGPSPRQKSPHPHGIAIDPSGRYALVADLGADRIFVHRLNGVKPSIGPAEPGTAVVKPGSGLRHVVFGPSGRFVYANAEFTGDIMVFRWDAATARLSAVETVATRPSGYTGELSSAEIGLAPDGRFLYLSNRGEDAIVVFAVDAATGRLREVQRLGAGGKAPASFAIDPSGRWLAVANEASGSVAVFGRDPASGRLTPAGGSLSVAHPVSVAFLPQKAEEAAPAMTRGER